MVATSPAGPDAGTTVRFGGFNGTRYVVRRASTGWNRRASV